MYCAEYCPLGYTPNGVDCTKDSDAELFCARIEGFENSWSTTSYLTLFRKGVYPAKYRGQFFDGSDSIDFGASTKWTLNHSFAFMCIVRPTYTTNKHNILFTKYDADEEWLRFFLTKNMTLGIYFKYTDDSTEEIPMT